jgi:ribosome biogenesis GTPase
MTQVLGHILTDQTSTDQPLVGIVLAIQANYYYVQVEASGDRPVQMLPLCTRRSRLKKIGQQVMVGDRVHVEEPDWESGRAAICHVEERRNSIGHLSPMRIRFY